MTDFCLLTALDIAQLIRTRQVSPLEVTQYYLDRLGRHNRLLGSFAYVGQESAIADAKEKTEYLAGMGNSEPLPPFFGVPMAVKDLNCVAGMPVSYGVAALRENLATYDDGVVAKMKAAGFTILGKTVTSQLGSFPYTEPPGFLPARNPWHLDHTAGGSSGGSAAAVAAALVPIAQGSDGGGSVRTPAACCGLVGFKPSRGRVSQAPVGDYQSGIACHGPLSSSVLDAAALLDVMEGYITGDPYWLPSPDRPFLETTEEAPGELRLAYAFSLPPFTSTPVIQGAVTKAIAVCENLGHQLEEACFDVTRLIEPFAQIWKAGVGASGIPLPLLEPVNQWLGETSGTAGDYLRGVRDMQVISRQIVTFMGQYDALILPVFNHQPPKVGEWAHLAPPNVVQKIIEWIAPCPPANAAGLPAIAIPVGFDGQGLPLSVQIIGKPAADATVLALAYQLEQQLQFNVPRQLPPHFPG
ncbi:MULTISPECIES: amidase [unclassified Synechocystis]|uniref:amidase n=1 Tax=unclassified Synechocystis TaxID=2640012 RepID=UPI00048AC8E1|nr:MULTISPECIES: amidase [unclassified Synechocystis]AIE76027.1 putative amidase [Synechocystis sp. PCC 6714]MCT0255067.1 amidase [Synechocystis sp. CS-94]